MSFPNAVMAEPKERDLPPATHNQSPGRPTVPPGFCIYIADIEQCLLNATAACEAMIEAKLNNNLAGLGQACGTALDETRAASALAQHLGKHISAHQRRHEGGARR